MEPDAPGFPLIPTWHEQLGSGTRVDTLRDSVTYDGWERLTVWVEKQLDTNWVARDTFAFDRAGNIKTTAGAEVYDLTTDRLTATAGCSSFSYDRAGNLISRTCGANTWTYQYDALNRLRSARYNGTLIVRYGYDVLGRRIAKRVYSNSTGGTVAYTRFVYRGANVGFETDSGGTIGLRYEYGPASDDLLAIQDTVAGVGKTVYYVVQDRLHSVRGLIKRDGTWLRSLRYGPYGAVVSNDSSRTLTLKLRYQWTGREYDSETGFYFFRARYYDPGVRRFIQADPIGYGGGGNLYAYGDGGPLEGRDASGMTYGVDPIPMRPWRSWYSGPAVYLDGAPLGDDAGDWDFSGPGLRDGTLSPWAGLDEAWADRLRFAQAQGPRAFYAYSDDGLSVHILYDDGTEEIRSGGDPAWRANNPGNLTANGEFAWENAAIGELDEPDGRRFAIFADFGSGWRAEVANLTTSTYQALTLNDAIAAWSRTDVATYQANVRSWTGISGSTLLSTLSRDQINLLASAIYRQEGHAPGTVTWSWWP